MNKFHRFFFRAVVGFVATASLGLAQTPAPTTSTKKTGSTEKAPPAPLPPPPLPVALYLTWQRDPVTTMTVHWHTDWTEGFADSALEFRAAGDASAAWSRAAGHAAQFPFTNRMVHTVEITGLRGDTIYEFRLGRLTTREPDGALLFTPHGPVQKFRTLPATLSRPVRFVSGGDIYGGSSPDLMSNMCKTAAAQDPEFAMIGGDIAYVNNEPKASSRWFDFFRVWRETMITKDGRMIPVVPAIGNHEVHGDTYQIRGGAPNRGVSPDRALFFYTLFSFPGRPGYNALDVGNYLSLVALDSFHSNPVPGPQTDWLRETLAKRRSVPFVVPFYHVPAYPSYRSFSGAISVAIRANWVPLFDEAGVRFAFENHDHAYKITHAMRGGEPHPDGTRYLGDGAWAVNTREVSSKEKAPYLDRAHSRNHVYVVTLHPGRAEITAIDPKGEEFDRLTIQAKR
jgi:acid phosphatase type 7